MSLDSGSSMSASRCVAAITVLSGRIMASSTARTVFSRAMFSACRLCGNTTMFFNATSGYTSSVSCVLSWRSCSLMGLRLSYSDCLTARVIKRLAKIDEPASGRLIFGIRRGTVTSCDEHWLVTRRYHIAVNDDLFDIRARWDIVHNIEQDIFNNGAQSSRARALLQRAFRRRFERIIGKDEFYAIELEYLLVLLDNSVLGFR